MNLVKTSFYTGLSTAVTFISGFIITKIVAVKIGPEGMAYTGQYQNSVAILAMLSTCAITTGVIRYLAVYKNEVHKQQQVISTAVIIILAASFSVSLFVIPASAFLSRSTFHTTAFWQVYLLYGLFIAVNSLNTLFASVLNGYKEIKKLTVINVLTSVASVVFTVTFAYTMGLKGVLIAGNFVAVFIFFIHITYIRKIKGIVWKPSFKNWDRNTAALLFAFTFMGVVSGFAAPAMQLLVRNRIISEFSLQEAGYWQAVTRISDYYLSFITTVLTVYYLPRLAEIDTKAELQKELLHGYKIILPVVAVSAVLIWLCKVWIVQLLFTNDFMPMLPLFKYQLMGDVLKIGSWLLGFVALSKALTKTFIFSEIVFSASFVILCYYLMNRFGIIGATYAFSINYALYWIAMGILLKKHIW